MASRSSETGTRDVQRHCGFSASSCRAGANTPVRTLGQDGSSDILPEEEVDFSAELLGSLDGGDVVVVCNALPVWGLWIIKHFVKLWLAKVRVVGTVIVGF